MTPQEKQQTIKQLELNQEQMKIHPSCSSVYTQSKGIEEGIIKLLKILGMKVIIEKIFFGNEITIVSTNRNK